MYPNSTPGISNYPNSIYPQIQNSYPYNHPNLNSIYNQTTSTPVESTTLTGRMIDKVDEIMPNEVRMDGSLGYFPMKDLSAIYVKQWDQDANLVTVKYIPDPNIVKNNETAEAEQSNILNQILNQLDDIQSLLKQNNTNTNKFNKTHNKKNDVNKESKAEVTNNV